KHLQFEYLEDHAEIAPDVFRSRYANGEEVVCNYMDKPFVYNGAAVAPFAYGIFSMLNDENPTRKDMTK
ncbi:MAG: hypothetical protein IJ658_03230, partial [Kiritimatiellae bacterium]|nr:hypothetical protein [Kiritimatiellia bacterium]